MAYLALVRHGESEWNAKGLWTGWKDIPLSLKGRLEAKKAARTLSDIKFDIAFTSPLVRATQTLAIIKKELRLLEIPIIEDKALNERNYGDYTGKNKWELKKEFGEERFKRIRRGWDVGIPNGETLKDVYNRVVPYYKKRILTKLKRQMNVLVSAHGNSLRALVKYLENLSDIEVENLEIATGEVYLYKINNRGNITAREIRRPTKI